MKWKRYCKLIVSTDSSNKVALDLSDYRIKFKISQAVMGRPCTAEITVYNIAKETADKIEVPSNAHVASKHLKVILDAGYEDEHAVVFQGDLWFKTMGRESETDTYMRLVAAIGDRANRYGFVNATLPKGATQEDIAKRIAQTYAAFGIKIDTQNLPKNLQKTKLPRGRVLYTLASDALHAFGANNRLDFGYTNLEGIVFVPSDAVYDQSEPVIVLDSMSGMVGRPRLTSGGVQVMTLLNPRIDVGTLIKIDNASIIHQSLVTEYTAASVSQNYAATDYLIDADGVYRVLSRTHEGDTRGQAWYTSLNCVAVNGGQPIEPSVYNTLRNL